jgi:exodeoxyribonuclease VII large subunit
VENSKRRWPAVRFRIEEVAVQGPFAVTQVSDALRSLDRDSDVDVIVIARGGGSVEDLLPFSDEALLRVVAASRTPVVSAIGHEQDAPLLDLVADARASTPTDAAKRIVPDVGEQIRRIQDLRGRARQILQARLRREDEWLLSLRNRPVLAHPVRDIDRRSSEVANDLARARRSVAHLLDRASDDVRHSLARVQALSPLATLQRGYAVVQHAEEIVRSPAAAPAGTALMIRLAGGRIGAVSEGEA